MTTPVQPEPEDRHPSRQPPPGHPVPAGIDPATGLPYSEKSRVAAGLLQLLPGAFLCLGGIGRIYAGHTALGIVQVVVTGFAWISVLCLGWILIGFIPAIAAWLWFVIDGVLLLAGRPLDGRGYPLRP